MHNIINVARWLAVIFVCVNGIQCSVLVPTYVLPPASFPQPRDQRSLSTGPHGVRTLARLAGGHLKLPSSNQTNRIPLDPAKTLVDHAKNTFAFVDKDNKNNDEKFAGIVVKTENQNVGWNQGQWDDGMLMSSAGNGKEKNKKKAAEDDDDKKTLADQVAEGKYGLIQKELFVKTPNRPGVLSYTSNPETKDKDNETNLGGLKNEEIWLAEDHLLVLKGGSFPEHNKQSESSVTWAPIDAYQAPPRQVKIPQNPEVPPPFPVRLSDDGPLVFLTPNGSIPAPLFPARPPGAGFSFILPPPSSDSPQAPPSPPNSYPPNFTPGGAPFPIAPYPFFPPRNESDFPFPFPGPINASFPGGLPPGASFLPPPGNLSDLYDEDDPSIYYPPPYSFSYQADNTSRVPAGPLVPGIVLPPPPDFFAPLEQTTKSTPTTTRPTAHAYAPTPAPPSTTVLKARPHSTKVYLPPTNSTGTSPNSVNIVEKLSTTPKTITITPQPTPKTPNKIVIISKPNPARKTQTTVIPNTIKTIKLAEKHPPVTTLLHKPIKTTLKPISTPVTNIYYPESYYEENTVPPSPKPFLVYGPPERSQINPFADKTYVTSTPIPLKTYYSNPNYNNAIPQIQYAKQKPSTVTRIRPDFIQNTGQNGKSVASFYFYEEPVSKAPALQQNMEYYDGRNYYQTINSNAQIQNEDYIYNQGSYTPSNNIEFKPVPSREPSPFFFIPQRQGSRTLTQEYFSVQKPKPQNNYVQVSIPQKSRPESFYEQIASIQQTIDYYTTHRPKNLYRQAPFRDARQKPKQVSRPVYQFSFQSNNIRPEQGGFRAPAIDSEPFRPMVTYSRPYNVENDYESATKTAYNTENLKVTTELPQPSAYYTTGKPSDYDYDDGNQEKKVYIKPNTQNPVRVTQKTKKIKVSTPTTKSPVDHLYYTKQEEGLFDDITKNYFTIFGQKIEHGNHDNSGIAVTAPISPIATSTISPPIENRLRYENINNPEPQPIISLASDTQVNYRQPRPLINPESEFIPIVNPEIQAKYEAEQKLKHLREQNVKNKVKNIEIIKSEGIEQSEKINNFNNEQLQLLRPIQSNRFIQTNLNNLYKDIRGPRTQVAEGRPGSLVAYRLPGEGAHVYFLTPQPTRSEYRTAEEIAALS